MKAFPGALTPVTRAARTNLNMVLLILVLALLAAVIWKRSGNPGESHTSAAAKATLDIEVFKVADPQPAGWNPTEFTDSLAARLGDVGGLSTKVVSDGRTTAEFTLTGDVRASDGRIVLSTRLMHTGERLPVWSGTFWRSRNSLSNFVDDVAAGVAQALYADIARRALTTTKERS